jgi:hypothetical protein
LFPASVDGVGPRAAEEGVDVGAPDQHVVPGAAGDVLDVPLDVVGLQLLTVVGQAVERDADRCSSRRVGDRVRVVAARHVVFAQTAVEQVVAEAAAQLKVADVTEQVVATAAAVETVVARTTAHVVGRSAAEELVVTRSAVQRRWHIDVLLHDIVAVLGDHEHPAHRVAGTRGAVQRRLEAAAPDDVEMQRRLTSVVLKLNIGVLAAEGWSPVRWRSGGGQMLSARGRWLGADAGLGPVRPPRSSRTVARRAR